MKCCWLSCALVCAKSLLFLPSLLLISNSSHLLSHGLCLLKRKYIQLLFGGDADTCSARNFSLFQWLVSTDQCKCKWRRWVNTDLYFYQWKKLYKVNRILCPPYPVSDDKSGFRDEAQLSGRRGLKFISFPRSHLYFSPQTVSLACDVLLTPLRCLTFLTVQPPGLIPPPPLLLCSEWIASLHPSACFPGLTVPAISSCTFLFSSLCRADHACKSSWLQDQNKSPPWSTRASGCFVIYWGPTANILGHQNHPCVVGEQKTYILIWSLRLTIELRSSEVAGAIGNAKCSNQMINLNFML